MMKAIWSKLLVLTAVLSIALVACGGPADEAEDVQQVLTLTETSSIPGMDTTQVSDTVSFTAMNNVFEGLYRLDGDNNPIEGMASSYEVSEDGLVFTFKLREDATWSNGTPVTANDFVYAWRKALHPDTLSEYAYIMNDIKNAAAIQDDESELYGQVNELGVVAVDEHTLEVTLENAVPYFVSLTAFPTFFPQNEEFVTEQGENYAQEVDNLIYNGPFVLSKWQHEQGWTYTKNPDYWDADTVKLETIDVKVMRDNAAVTRLYTTGEVDRALLTAEYVDQYKDHEDYGTIQEPTVFFIRLNQGNEFIANENIRKAIANGFDKEGITNVILNNGSVPANYFMPEGFVTGPNGEDFREGQPEYHTEGIEAARAYFEKGLEELGRDSISIELLNYDSENSKIIGEYLKNQLETNLGNITVTIKPQPFGQKLELESAQNYDISFSGWGPDYADPMTYMDMFVTDGGYNNQSYSNPEYDRLINEAKTDLTDLQARWEKLQEAERILLEDDAAIAPMYQRGQAFLQGSHVKEFYVHPFGPDKTFKWTYIEGK